MISNSGKSLYSSSILNISKPIGHWSKQIRDIWERVTKFNYDWRKGDESHRRTPRKCATAILSAAGCISLVWLTRGHCSQALTIHTLCPLTTHTLSKHQTNTHCPHTKVPHAHIIKYIEHTHTHTHTHTDAPHPASLRSTLECQQHHRTDCPTPPRSLPVAAEETCPVRPSGWVEILGACVWCGNGSVWCGNGSVWCGNGCVGKVNCRLCCQRWYRRWKWSGHRIALLLNRGTCM